MATTNNKKMAFSIENLAKSSRTDDNQANDCNGTYFYNRNPWQDGNAMNLGDWTKSVCSSPYFTNGNGLTSQCIPKVQFGSPIGNLRDSFRLSPDDGYSSQNSTPSVSGSCQKRRRIDDDVDISNSISPPCSTGSSMKRKRIDAEVDKLRARRISQAQTPNGNLTDSSFESTCALSDSDEGIGETPRPKKARTAFSNDQVQALEVRYQSRKYLPAGERSKLATELGLTDQQVKTWFQNRRMKEKRKQKDDAFTGGMPIPTGGVDISQLQALGLPCPPPYTINNKHEQLMKDDSIPNFPLTTSSSQSPMFRTTQQVPFYSRYQPMTNGLGSSPDLASRTNHLEGYS
ncbi:homeobox protein vent1-like [Mizuhopecten yessoensis]|uniref:Brain-specific homeobox protein n=1 Tax=Mizuhopecten yessoensis TaxID=6573 RepID=A0A210PYE2_MIZYE|nr:homeobox protein vent1-like [Mizuhopecten yessoensis]OWF41501.1 Brain-specific homeobox protein [Mizuhopecten yessoensis]